jgi:hypothetical protein
MLIRTHLRAIMGTLYMKTDKTESTKENVKWLKQGKRRPFKMIKPVRMREEGPSALEMVQEGRNQFSILSISDLVKSAFKQM